MFVQVITATAVDTDAATTLHERWERELRPGATGFLGSTIGVAPDGRMVAVARFESAAAARANSGRPEQDAWWAEMSRTLTDARFHDSEDVAVVLRGPAPDAGFVQVIRGHVLDPAALAGLRADLDEVEALEQEHRPEILGELLAVHDDGSCTEVVWFESEAAARAGEAAPPTPALQALLDRFDTAVRTEEYFDLSAPWTT